MKKLFMALAMLSMTAITLADIGPVGRSASINADGSEGAVKEKFFINVKNTSGGAFTANTLVILDETELDGFSVNTSATAGKTPHCLVVEACADDALCKCQTYGVATIVYDATGDNAVAGAPMFLSESNAGQVYGITTVGAGDVSIGTFLEASATSGSISGFLKMR